MGTQSFFCNSRYYSRPVKYSVIVNRDVCTISTQKKETWRKPVFRAKLCNVDFGLLSEFTSFPDGQDFLLSRVS